MSDHAKVTRAAFEAAANANALGQLRRAAFEAATNANANGQVLRVGFEVAYATNAPPITGASSVDFGHNQ